MRVTGESENRGVEQEHLNQAFGAGVRITGLRAEHGHGIEFLEYLTPPGGRDLPDDAKSNGLFFWNAHLAADDLAGFASNVTQLRARLVSTGIVNVRRSALGLVSRVIVRNP